MEQLESKSFDEISIGDGAEIKKQLTKEDILLFAAMSGDVNPAHLDEEYAKASMFKEVIGHGMWSGSFISTILGTIFPGPGTIYLGQSFRFKRPVKEGDVITVAVEVTKINTEKKRITLLNTITNQLDQVVVTGESEVIPPNEKIIVNKIAVPRVQIL